MSASRTTTGRARALLVALTLLLVAAPAVADQVKTDAGIVAGFTAPGSSVRVFRGIPCLVHRLVGRLLAHADKS